MQNCRYSHLLKAEQHNCSVHGKEQLGWKRDGAGEEGVRSREPVKMQREERRQSPDRQ